MTPEDAAEYVTQAEHQAVLGAMKKLYRITAALVIVVIVTAGIAAYLIRENRLRSQDIQTQRFNSMVYNCQQTNDRNRNTVAALDQTMSKIEDRPGVSAERLAQLRQSRDFTVLLINALAPVRDCSHLSLDPTGNETPTTTDTETTTTAVGEIIIPVSLLSSLLAASA